MNGFRIFLSLTLTALCALQWYRIIDRAEQRADLYRYADQLVEELELETGRPYPPASKKEMYAIVQRAPGYDGLLTPAVLNTISAALAWLLTFVAIYRRDRLERTKGITP